MLCTRIDRRNKGEGEGVNVKAEAKLRAIIYCTDCLRCGGRALRDGGRAQRLSDDHDLCPGNGARRLPPPHPHLHGKRNNGSATPTMFTGE